MKKKRKRRAQARDIALLSPEEAASLLRLMMRQDIGDKWTRLRLAERALLSANPGESASMSKYLEAIRAGRRIRYATFPAHFHTVEVSPDLRADVESAFTEGDET